MLSIPTESLVTTLSFAVADDGTLSQLPGMLDHRQTPAREEQTVLLPLDTLDSVVACPKRRPRPSARSPAWRRVRSTATPVVRW